MTAELAPPLTDEEQALFEKGIDELNRGHYFECHETLEDLWTGIRGPSRDFYQGLIQLAVAFYHLGRANVAGARSLLDRGLARLAKYPDRYAGIELEALRASARDLRRRLEKGEIEEAAPEVLPKVERVNAGGS